MGIPAIFLFGNRLSRSSVGTFRGRGWIQEFIIVKSRFMMLHGSTLELIPYVCIWQGKNSWLSSVHFGSFALVVVLFSSLLFPNFSPLFSYPFFFTFLCSFVCQPLLLVSLRFFILVSQSLFSHLIWTSLPYSSHRFVSSVRYQSGVVSRKKKHRILSSCLEAYKGLAEECRTAEIETTFNVNCMLLESILLLDVTNLDMRSQFPLCVEDPFPKIQNTPHMGCQINM